MVWPADYHMHTPLCRHAVGEPTELAAQALKAGLREIGFSDHSPMPRDDFDDWRMRYSDLDQYVAKVEQARREHPSLTIKLALEVDYLPGCENWVQQLASRYRWDYLIGSVHYVSDSWAVDNPNALNEWKSRDVGAVWAAYVARLNEAAGSGMFDIIAHIDLCKKFRFYPPNEVTPLYEEFFKTARKSGVAIELNTGGLRKDCAEIYPGQALLNSAARAGIPITFGSDAHAPGEVGMGFAEAVQSAKQAGYDRYCQFTGRKRTVVAL